MEPLKVTCLLAAGLSLLAGLIQIICPNSSNRAKELRSGLLWVLLGVLLASIAWMTLLSLTHVIAGTVIAIVILVIAFRQLHR